jgi:hypothetical protein
MTATSSAFTRFILSQIRVASARVRLTVTEIDDVGVSLAGNFIDADTAVAWMDEIAPGLVVVPSSIITHVST